MQLNATTIHASSSGFWPNTKASCHLVTRRPLHTYAILHALEQTSLSRTTVTQFRLDPMAGDDSLFALKAAKILGQSDTTSSIHSPSSPVECDRLDRYLAMAYNNRSQELAARPPGSMSPATVGLSENVQPHTGVLYGKEEALEVSHC